jgi:hypothetical protein
MVRLRAFLWDAICHEIAWACLVSLVLFGGPVLVGLLGIRDEGLVLAAGVVGGIILNIPLFIGEGRGGDNRAT